MLCRTDALLSTSYALQIRKNPLSVYAAMGRAGMCLCALNSAHM